MKETDKIKSTVKVWTTQVCKQFVVYNIQYTLIWTSATVSKFPEENMDSNAEFWILADIDISPVGAKELEVS
mgnify:CR=1 FL=1